MGIKRLQCSVLQPPKSNAADSNSSLTINMVVTVALGAGLLIIKYCQHLNRLKMEYNAAISGKL